jgi:iron(III) transport system ATP-binding protein
MALIEINRVSKAFPGAGKKAVNNLSFHIETGQIVTLLGPSGCGKTTILRLLAGFERPDAGTIKLNGRCVAGDGSWVPPEKRGIGMVFQDYALFPHMTVAQNIVFPIAGRRDINKEQRIAEMLRLAGLEGLAGRYPHELSGGQQQRVALARALCPEPVVVLLDEPFSNLDVGLKERMREEICEIIKKTATTAVFVSHDQKDALAVSDQILVLRDGVLVQQGTPREIYQYPASPFVAGFVGKSNILPGTVTDDTNIIETLTGPVPCFHNHGARPGEKVLLSVRPDSFELSEDGGVQGVIIKSVFVGNAIEAVLCTESIDGTRLEMQVHIHPEKDVRVGDTLRFKVLPDFVAVID